MRFLDYSKGSCSELRTQIYIGMDIGYIETNSGKDWLDRCEQVSSMISGLAAKIKLDMDGKEKL